MILLVLKLLGSLAMFLYGMSLMSDFIINISQSVIGAKAI